MKRRATYRPMRQWYQRPTYVLWALTTISLYAFLVVMSIYGFSA